MIIVAIDHDVIFGEIRSEYIYLTYFVEGASRPNSYGFLVPGLETKGNFLRVNLYNTYLLL